MYNYDRRTASLSPAEQLAHKAEEATAETLHRKANSLGHLRAGVAHMQAAKAFRKEGNLEDAAYHEGLAHQHKEDMLQAIPNEVYDRLTKAERDTHHNLRQDDYQAHQPFEPSDHLKKEIARETAKVEHEMKIGIGF